MRRAFPRPFTRKAPRYRVEGRMAASTWFRVSSLTSALDSKRRVMDSRRAATFTVSLTTVGEKRSRSPRVPIIVGP